MTNRSSTDETQTDTQASHGA